jgi:hypothetical protein
MPRAQIKDEKMYQKLRDEGEGKNKSARIANAAAASSRSKVARKAGKSGSYDDWTKQDLIHRAREIALVGHPVGTGSRHHAYPGHPDGRAAGAAGGTARGRRGRRPHRRRLPAAAAVRRLPAAALYATRFGEGFGTLYTAEYRPGEGLARYYWPGQTWVHSLDRLGPGRIEVRLGPA